jgi:hypothetical protein
LVIRTTDGDLFYHKLSFQDIFHQTSTMLHVPKTEIRGHGASVSAIHQHFNGKFLCTVDDCHEIIFWSINDSALHLSRIPLTFAYRTLIDGHVIGWLKSDLILVLQERDIISMYRFEPKLDMVSSSVLNQISVTKFCCERGVSLSTKLYSDYESIALCCTFHGKFGMYRYGKLYDPKLLLSKSYQYYLMERDAICRFLL